MTELIRTIDPRWYDQPGFPELEGAWCQVFESREPEGYILNPVEVLKLVDSVRASLIREYEYSTKELDVLESIACRYARESTQGLEIEMEELTNGY